MKKSHLRELCKVFMKLRTEKEALAFLKDILTPAELKDIVQRWQIVKRLAAGVPQREISRVLKISIAKVTRGSRALKRSYGGFKKVL